MRQMVNFIEFRFSRGSVSSLFGPFLCSRQRPPPSQMLAGSILSVPELCALMGLIDLNNIRGCGDVIKAEITSL